MPEGPSLVILKETIQKFARRKVLLATGTAAIDMDRLRNKTIRKLSTWGKHLLISFDGFYIRIHLLMFGTWRINERKKLSPRLSLQFSNAELNFYTCAVKMIDGSVDDDYDWRSDVMNDDWDPALARKKMKAFAGDMICDVLLDQDIFAGVGNIIKNEILFISYIHPQSRTGKIPLARMRELLKQARQYSFQFLEWKKAGTLKKHWLAYAKKTCPRCKIPLHKAYPGIRKRRSFFCDNCQKLY